MGRIRQAGIELASFYIGCEFSDILGIVKKIGIWTEILSSKNASNGWEYNQEEGASYINVTYTVTNTTSLKSLFAQLLPDLEYPGPMGNWTQTYTWSEKIPCCNDND